MKETLQIVLKKKTTISTESGLHISYETRQINAETSSSNQQELNKSQIQQTFTNSNKNGTDAKNKNKLINVNKEQVQPKGKGKRVDRRVEKVELESVQNVNPTGLYTPPRPNTSNSNTRYNGTPKRQLFEEYYARKALQNGLKSKKLHQGVLRMNPKNRNHGYVTIKGMQSDIFIQGKKYINRALNGDTVIVELFEGEALQREIAFYEAKNKEKQAENNLRQSKCDVDVEDLLDDEKEEFLPEEPLEYIQDEGQEQAINLPFGKVVNLVERGPSNASFVGFLRMQVVGFPSNNRCIWFKPCDKKAPLISIDKELAPKEFLENPNEFENTFYTAFIHRWSPAFAYPSGKISGKLGQMGELPVETEALLADAGVTWSDFTENVLLDLPTTPWTIPQEEVQKRRDFRNERVFSIDPLTAKDLDDAISIKLLPDNNYEVGVHIADVSHFVHSGTNLDKEALFRATTVYLVQYAIPMLPRLLCEQLCSLNPQVDRLAFSVVWKMNSNGEILQEPWFGKSIIRSRAKLAYEHAQAIIENKSWKSLTPVDMDPNTTFEDIRKDVLLFYELSLKLRRKRYENGALSIQSIKLWFTLDTVGNPTHSGVYQIKDANRLIEEFMLLANMAVATKISKEFSSASLLRCHPPPLDKGVTKFLELAKKLGFEFDASSAGSLHASFEKIPDPIIRHTWRLLAIKFMKRANYFNTGDHTESEYAHYALSVPLYTHFTSPIRRYADLVVHRLLFALLSNDSNPYTSDEISSFAKQCNSRKEISKLAQDASQKLYLCAYLSTLAKTAENGKLEDDAIVTEVGSRFYDVIVPRYGIEKRVWVEDLIDLNQVVGSRFLQKDNSLEIHWIKQEVISVLSLKDTISALSLKETIVQDTLQETATTSSWEDVNDSDSESLQIQKQDHSLDHSKDKNVKPTKNQVYCQRVKMFDTIRVRIEPILDKSPPDVKLYGLSPEIATPKETFVLVQDVIMPKSMASSVLIKEQAEASCPSMAEDRD